MCGPDLARTRAWLSGGSVFLLDAVDRLSDDQLREPSLLPGWTRAHVVAHLARNAEALIRLASWARTGVETPMYASREQRDADIAASAELPAKRLRAELVDTATELDAAIDRLDERAWAATLRNAQGRAIPATQVPWLRVREVWLHTVDLDAGAQLTDLPAELLDALLTEVSATLSERPDCPAAALEPEDRERTWRLGPQDGPEEGPQQGPVTLRGTAADLAGWLTGRTGSSGVSAQGTGGEVPVPDPPRWL
jgi:maleylpyruvate isomerase